MPKCISSFCRSPWLWVLCSLACSNSYAEIYAYIDSKGKLMVSDENKDGRYKRFDPKHYTPVAIAIAKVEPRLNSNSKAQSYSTMINAIADEVGISAHLIHAVIEVESAYNPQALSPKGAQGMMQLIPATAQRFGVVEAHDPEANIRGGARYLKVLLALFNNDLQLTLAAYNAGEGAVKKYNNTVPPYPETQAYVQRVLTLFKQRQS